MPSILSRKSSEMGSDLGILKNMTAGLLKRIVVIVQMSCMLFAVVIHYTFSELFFVFAPWLLVVNLLTLVALPSVYKKLNSGRKEELLYLSEELEEVDSLNRIDLWDRAVVGFYVVSNAAIILVLFIVLYI